MTIYEITGQYKLLENAMALNPDDESLQAEFDKIEDAIEVKADNYAKVIRNLQADVEAIKTEEKRLYDRRKVIENNIKSCKNNLMWSMKQTGKEKFKTELFSFSVAKNGGKAPLVVDVPPAELPAELQSVTIDADKDALRKYIEETGDLSYGHFEDKGEHLNIR